MMMSDASELGNTEFPSTIVLNTRKFLLLAVLAYPYHVFPIIVDTIFAGSAAALTLTLSAVQLSAPRISAGVGTFLTGIAVWTAASLAQSGQPAIVASQANHLWQFAIFILAFSPDVNRLQWTRVSQSRLFFWIVSISTGATLIYSLVNFGFMLEYTLNVVVCLVLLYQNKTVPMWQKIAVASLILISIGLSPRSTAILVLAVYIFVFAVNPPAIFVKISSILVILMTIVLYILVDAETMMNFVESDYNIYIRFEFLRSAWSLLKDNLIFGLGFGPEFRPRLFGYLTVHPLLSDPTAISVVSNHHSIFDTAYRLGVPMAAILMYVLFISPRLTSDDRMGKFFMLALAFGMSINAWFEDQTQVVMVAMMSVFLFARARTPRANS